jgi:L-seryl-tRNA(Ser) seleniumtransferase
MGAGSDSELSGLPAVHELASALGAPHALAVAAARRAIEERRAALLGGEASGSDAGADVALRARELLSELESPSLRRVINATGVIVHTNLGRAPLAAAARAAVLRAAEGYGNLELSLETGARASRHDHVEGLLAELTGAEAAIVVNNGAGAVLLATAALAGSGRGVIVSRGQLVEIGGGFRIPEVVAQSGARLIEVGTTNRTRISDYEQALAASSVPGAGGVEVAILRVHPSNFRTLGFVEDVSIEALCGLGVPVIDDVGSGVLADAHGIQAIGDEPAVKRSIEAGAALVCCSGDKLLGGPQAGLLLGRRDAVRAARRHPLARALRIDKLSLAALQATLMLYRDPAQARREIPVLAMLDAGEAALQARAEQLRAAIGEAAEVVRACGKVGGGALPLLELEGPAVALGGEGGSAADGSGGGLDPVAVLSELRYGDPPVIARIHEGRVLLDPRTLADDELEPVAAVTRAALAAVARR